MEMIVVLVLIMVGLIFYMLPALVAHKRAHHNASAITVLNLLAGWTGLGWLVAIVWAFTSRQTERS